MTCKNCGKTGGIYGWKFLQNINTEVRTLTCKHCSYEEWLGA